MDREVPISRIRVADGSGDVRKRSVPKALLFRIAETVFPDEQFVSILRYELSLLIISLYAKLSPVEWLKRWKRRNSTDLKINIGNGPFKHEGWMDIDCSISLKPDVVACDLRRKWPLRSGTAKYIFSEHVFEHFAYPSEIGHVLRECFRILKTGGVLRVIVPNAERYLRAYADDDQCFFKEVGGASASKLAVVNVMMRENGFHKYSYDYDELERVLRSAGFRDVVRSSLKGSSHTELNLDFDDRQRELVSLYVEAVK
jgi:predicted SAM-dependent methyltransferase